MDYPAPAAAPCSEVRQTSGTRVESLDALRAAVTLLVVLHHTAIAYGAIGGWFYREVHPDSSWGSRLLVFFCTVNQAFFMGLFFLIAGYFTPGSLARKGSAAFLRDRAIRLGVPLLVFGVVIGPATIALARTAHGEPFLGTFTQLVAKGTFEPGPLWFCEALLLFSIAAVIWNFVFAGHGERDAPPSNAALLAAALLTAFAAFALRLRWPVGAEWHSLQLGYFASYVVLFVAGVHAARSRWIERPRPDQVALWRGVMWATLPILPVLALSAKQSRWLQGTPEGGWTILAATYALWEPFVAWGLILRLLDRFQHRTGAAWRALSDRAYTIFVIHPPVVVAVTIALHPVQLPVLVKFVIAGILSCLLCFFIAGGVLRLPGARRVL